MPAPHYATDKSNYTIQDDFAALRFKLKRRALYLAFGVAAFMIAYSVGSSVEMSAAEKEALRDEFSKLIEDIDETGIFLNNIRIALVMFVPGLGVAFGAFSGFSTGMVFTAIAQDTPELQGISPLIILVTPFGIMEVFSYGLAMSRSGMLVYYLVKRRPWREYAMPTLIEIGIVVAVLLAAAVIEWWMIEAFGGIDTIDLSV